MTLTYEYGSTPHEVIYKCIRGPYDDSTFPELYHLPEDIKHSDCNHTATAIILCLESAGFMITPTAAPAEATGEARASAVNQRRRSKDGRCDADVG